MTSRRSILAVPPIAALLAHATAATASTVFAENRIAIRGADPVAYHTLGRPVVGRAEFSQVWRGATWRFASAGNRDRFAAAPERYAPAFGGFCAWAVAQGYTAPIDPAAWRIVEGRLYLNCDRAVQRRWERDIAGFIRRADANWPRLERQAGG